MSCPCICGERVVVSSEAVVQGIRAHQAASVHRRWRELGGMEAEVYGASPATLLAHSLAEQEVVKFEPEKPRRRRKSARWHGKARRNTSGQRLRDWHYRHLVAAISVNAS